MTGALSTIRRTPRAIADAAGDVQDLAFIGFFQLAARFDGPATVLFDAVERVEAAALGIVGLGQRVFQGNTDPETRIAEVARG